MMSSEDKVMLSEIINNKGVLTLNRPKSMNALNDPVVDAVLEKLLEWKNTVNCVIIKSSNEKVFCAGGDIVHFGSTGSPSNCDHLVNLARKGSTLIYIISRYKPPWIALIDGITLGGGVGISFYGRFCVATERTVLALPEIAIGYLPDVGASYYLSRLEGKLGLYLALTGHRLKGKDVVKTGFATHFVRSHNIPELYNALIEAVDDFEGIINQYAEDVSTHTFSLASQTNLIKEAFSAPTVEEILDRLKKEGSEFSLSTVDTINKMSPLALKMSKKLLEKAANMSLEECLRLEFHLVKATFKAVSSPDVYEGVRALLIEKDRSPKWKPATLEEVTDEMVDILFLPSCPEEELVLPTD